MKEIVNRDTIQKTPETIDDENLASRQEFHREDIVQVGKIHDQITQLQITAKNNCENIAKLLPLVGLIPTLNDVVENQKANIYMGRKLIRWVGYVSAMIGLIYLIFRFWKEIK